MEDTVAPQSPALIRLGLHHVAGYLAYPLPKVPTSSPPTPPLELFTLPTRPSLVMVTYEKENMTWASLTMVMYKMLH